MWVAYCSLFGIALYHNEGLAGLMFRLTLGVVMMYASAEVGLLASLKTEAQADKDIFKDWHVKRYVQKLARQSAMADLDLTFAMHKLDILFQEKIYTLQRERETQQQIQRVKSASSSDTTNSIDKAKFDNVTLNQANAKRKASKREALDKMFQILTTDPIISLTDIARQPGRSRQKVYGYFAELESSGELYKNGKVYIDKR